MYSYSKWKEERKEGKGEGRREAGQVPNPLRQLPSDLKFQDYFPGKSLPFRYSGWQLRPHGFTEWSHSSSSL